MNIKKNDIVELKIMGMTAEGMGVGRCENGMAVFVPLTAVGDVIDAKIVKVAKSFAYGRLERLKVAAEDRIEPDCPVFSQCGGCCYRHISYEAELRIKTDRVRDALTRIGGFKDLPVREIIGAESRDGYRNKALLPLGLSRSGELEMGFYAVNSHRIVNCEECRLQPREFNTAMRVFREWEKTYGDEIYDESTHSGVMRRLYLRWGERTGELMACVVVNANGLHHENELVEMLREALPELTGVVINTNRERTNVALGKKCRTVWGKGTIRDELCGLDFHVSPLSFYQVNRTQAERLYEKAAEYAGLTGSETLLDLYCGAGTIGLSMAERCERLIGVEIVPEAIENAKKNAADNHVENAEFICGDAAAAAQELSERGVKPDVIILDPPRKGCSREMVEGAVAFAPKRIVYVSCDPATLARDLKIFNELGYCPVEATPVDMFPGTGHVETVVKLVRKKPDAYIDITVDMDELDLTSSEAKATYKKIKEYILEKHNVKVSSLYIAQVKQKYGIIERENYNKPSDENARQPKCPPEKETLIEEALKHFKMIS